MEESESAINLQELSNDNQDEAKAKEEKEKQGTMYRFPASLIKYWLVKLSKTSEILGS